MSNEPDNRIARYADGEMDAAERQAFEAELARDAALRDAVSLYRETKALLELDAQRELRNRIKELDEEQSKTASPWGSAVRVAAVVILLLLPTIWLLQPASSENDLLSDYLDVYPDRVTVMGDMDDSLQVGMGHYNDGNYVRAARTLSSIPADDPSAQPDALFYWGLAALHAEDYQVAVEALSAEHVLASRYGTTAKWYRVLAVLGANDLPRAVRLVDDYLGDSSNAYKLEEARRLREQLQKRL